MQMIDLSGDWRVASLDGVFSLPGTVPGSFFYDLERSGYWGDHDVFYRENNRQCVEIADRDFVYRRTFLLPQSLCTPDMRLYLEADGLDTLAEIRLNGRLAGSTDNMFRRYRFLIDDMVSPGENEIEIVFRNTVAEIARRQKIRPLWNPHHTLDGAVHLRKSHSSFGWDWGPVIPDLGIWRPIRVAAYDGARMADVRVTQIHAGDQVHLRLAAQVERWAAAEMVLEWCLTHPDGEATVVTCAPGSALELEVVNPQRWWPNGYGAQPLYKLACRLLGNGCEIDRQQRQIGLRTLRLVRRKDRFGESFEFAVNGISIFARGANYIPEDVYLTRPDRARTERLIADAAAANFNCLRVWGGGVYPPDHFYELCDRYGLIVWQDLMFACGAYDVRNPDFRANVAAEIRDVLLRIRHHACLCLICGNNEMEWGFVEWDFPITKEMRSEYIELYEKLAPQIVQEICPEIDYWPASPSSGGRFEVPNADDRGDVHYWEVWHGNKPFTEYRNHYFRFLSEFGFESFPALKTIASFTTPEDRNIFSPVLEDHQRCDGGNAKIFNYIAQYFRYPKDFASLVYVSQLSQAEAMRYAVEHLRRHRGRCMGATYWQLNDNWPVASWSGIDYFGRWKALHYVARRIYDPILVSCEESATGAKLHVTNDTLQPVAGALRWRLQKLDGALLKSGDMQVEIGAHSSEAVCDLDFAAELQTHNPRGLVFAFDFLHRETGIRRSGTAAFVPYKHLNLPDPALAWEVEACGEHFEIRITATAFAKFVSLDLANADAVFSDNFFDLEAGETRRVTTENRCLSQAQLQRQLIVRSLYDSFE